MAGLAALLALWPAGTTVVATGHPADVCLEIAGDLVSPAEWDAVAAAVGATVTERAALFPRPQFEPTDSRLDIESGHPRQAAGTTACLEPGTEWTARFGRDFLAAGADQMLADAPTTLGIDSDVTIEWYPEEDRLRTTLVFAGPLDIPNGTCWIDDALRVDDTTGTVTTSGDQGVKTSPFAEGACGRFFDHLPDGGAGGQAVTLLPTVVALADGGELRFVAEDVRVSEHTVSVSGRLERD